jgi:hypothetical protein
MIPTFNTLKPRLYPFAGAWNTPMVTHAPVYFGMEVLGLPLDCASVKGGFDPGRCGNPANLVRLPQLVPVDKMVLPSTEGIGGVDGKAEFCPIEKKKI